MKKERKDVRRKKEKVYNFIAKKKFPENEEVHEMKTAEMKSEFLKKLPL